MAASKAEALDLLQSAIWHCQQNGIVIQYVNKIGVLWLKVPEAEFGSEGIRPVAVQPAMVQEAATDGN